jgi:GTPase Era involved in 16S rRNA processing
MLRRKTIGVAKYKINFDKASYEVIDAGGARSERKKWSQFENVNTIIFFVSLSDYNQTCYEDGEKNRLQESLDTFNSVCNEIFDHELKIFLIFNKEDLFKKKIKDVNLKDHFKDFNGKNDKSYEYIEKKFKSLNKKNHQLTIYTTSILNANNIRKILDSIKLELTENTLVTY